MSSRIIVEGIVVMASLIILRGLLIDGGGQGARNGQYNRPLATAIIPGSTAGRQKSISSSSTRNNDCRRDNELNHRGG